MAAFNVPPNDTGAEAAVLAALLQNDPATSSALRQTLTAADFYDPAHVTIYDAAISLMERKSAVDAVTVSAELRRRGSFDTVGGANCIAAITGQLMDGGNAAYYAAIVKHNADLRRIIAAAQAIAVLARSETELDSRELATKAAQMLFDAVPQTAANAAEWHRAGSLFTAALQAMDARAEGCCGIGGMSTGYGSIDRLFNGMTPGDLVVIAGRPSMGKSAILQNIGQNVANSGKVVGFFSAEMKKETVVTRMLSSLARINSGAIKVGTLDADANLRMSVAIADHHQTPFYIEDLTMNVNRFEERAVALRAKAGGLDLILVDYLQFLGGVEGKRYASEREKISDITIALKQLAKKMNVPVIVAAQLSRSVERRDKKRPIMSDLAESGKIEQEADIIAFLYRASYYEDRQPSNVKEAAPATRLPDDTEFIVAKNRNGETGWVKLDFRAEYTQFEELAEDDQGGWWRDED